MHLPGKPRRATSYPPPRPRPSEPPPTPPKRSATGLASDEINQRRRGPDGRTVIPNQAMERGDAQSLDLPRNAFAPDTTGIIHRHPVHPFPSLQDNWNAFKRGLDPDTADVKNMIFHQPTKTFYSYTGVPGQGFVRLHDSSRPPTPQPPENAMQRDGLDLL